MHSAETLFIANLNEWKESDKNDRKLLDIWDDFITKTLNKNDLRESAEMHISQLERIHDAIPEGDNKKTIIWSILESLDSSYSSTPYFWKNVLKDYYTNWPTALKNASKNIWTFMEDAD